jgi:hypothetical protein
MSKIKSVYIVEPLNQEWIIEALMRDIALEFNKLGIHTKIGPEKFYQGEDVVFNSRYLSPTFKNSAKVNSLFITHIDDVIKERELKLTFDTYNSFVCLSPEDASFLISLKGSTTNVIGINLPSRSSNVQPLHLALFSACYEDGRKNEQWILDYFNNRPNINRNAFLFSFLGWGWARLCSELDLLDINYKVTRYSRTLIGEYALYKHSLSDVDVLIYPGFDGGSMSIYDAIGAGIEAIVSDISYHKGLEGSVTLFKDRNGFFAQLDRLYNRHSKQQEVLLRRSARNYASTLLSHWNSVLESNKSSSPVDTSSGISSINSEILIKYRSNYKKMSLSRFRSAIIRLFQRIFVI